MSGSFPSRYLSEIAGQPEAIRRAAAGLRDQAVVLRRLGEIAPARQLVFTGMGGSYAVCYVPVTSLGAAGRAALMVDAAELVHFRRPMLDGQSLLVVVSQSGESAEITRLVAETGDGRARPRVVSVTNGLANSLAQAGDCALDTRAGDELGPSTLTFVGALVVLSALAVVLSGGAVPDAIAAATGWADAAATRAHRLLERAEAESLRLREWLGDRSALTLLGRGTARAATEMGALLFKEAARFPAESLQSAQFRHGPLELTGAQSAIAIVATEPETRALDMALASELLAAGAAVLVVTPDGAGPAGALTIATGALDRRLLPAVTVIPFQLLAGRLAGERGYEPCALELASKVTARE